MLNSIEIKGYFFLPESPNDQLAGILKFNQNEGVELDLFGHFSNFANPSSKDTNLILGFTSNGKKMTLLNCYQKSGSMNIPGFPQSKISALYLFMNQHFYSVNDIAFDTCSIEYEGLNNWLNISGFDMPNYDRENHEYLFRYKRPNKIAFNLIDTWNAEIVFDFYGPSEFFIPTSLDLEQKAIMTFVPEAKSEFKFFFKFYSSFSSFLSINYFSYPLTKSILFKEISEKKDELDRGFNEIELYFKLEINHEKYEKHINHVDFLIEYKDYGSEFTNFIQKWFSLSDKIDVSINILTECFMHRRKPTELHFLSLVQALENMHRRCSNSPGLHLLARLNDIIDNLPLKVKIALLENEVDFTKRIKDNRNYYTHYSDTYKQKAISLSELFILSEKLKIILMTSVMQKLSFTNEQIENFIFTKGVYIFNHLIKTN